MILSYLSFSGFFWYIVGFKFYYMLRCYDGGGMCVFSFDNFFGVI